MDNKTQRQLGSRLLFASQRQTRVCNLVVVMWTSSGGISFKCRRGVRRLEEQILPKREAVRARGRRRTWWSCWHRKRFCHAITLELRWQAFASRANYAGE